MNVILAKNSGFCAGVKYTITKAKEELAKNNGEIFCLGEIIHNKQVIENLEKSGLKIIDSIESAKDKVIIRAHGTTKNVYDYAKCHNIKLIDLTCPNVLKVHKQVQIFSANNYFVFLFGFKEHPETIGTFSFCSDNSCILESPLDIPFAISKFEQSNLENIFIISQTTFSSSLFDEMVKEISNKLSKNVNIHIEKSICNATYLRQKEAEEIASKVDVMIIIGGKNSSNTQKLYEIAQKNCKNTLFIQTKTDLDSKFLKQFKNVGVVARSLYS